MSKEILMVVDAVANEKGVEKDIIFEAMSEHLKITLVIEVGPGREAEVEAVKPRVIDILNGFLRAVDEREFHLPRSMERLRAQMLRRVQLVTPEGAVRDLLIQEFVLI